MRILHVANFGYNNFGAAFYNTDRKLSAGFVRNGHFVYEFSLRDLARWGTVLRSKRFGAAWANKALLKTCERMAPDLVLLGHAQLITADTLREIRRRFPATRIALWYVDPLFYPDKIAYIREFAPFLDAIFATTGGEWLEQLGLPSVLRSYFPNVSERSVENSENFRRRQFDHELIYCGTVGDDLPRRQFMESLQQSLQDLPLRFQGLLGQPPIEGIGYVQALAGSRMGLNHSRRNDVTLYSSDRIAQLTGHGLLALTPRIPGFELLFGEGQVAYFDSLDELVDKVRHYHAHPDEAAQVAEAGWRQAHSCCGAERVARYMEEAITGREFSEPYEWLGHVFRPLARV
jgi:hypothetical protein